MNDIIDVLILANTANVDYYKLLKKCITSIKNSVDVTTVITLVESNSKLENKNLKELLPIDNIVFPKQTFNYNKFLNIGLKECNNEKILITNNDVFYENDTLKILTSHLSDYDSVSPWDIRTTPLLYKQRGIYEGYDTSRHIAGYSILTTRSVINTIGGFDERFTFWYADDDYALSLKANNLKHALIGYASVLHGFEKSHSLFDDEERRKRTYGSREIFLNKWGL